MNAILGSDLFQIHATVQEALEDIISLTSTAPQRKAAFTTLEKLLATSCHPNTPILPHLDQSFLALQDTFECNVPSRLLPWLASCTSRFEALLKDTRNQTREDVAELAEHLHQCLILLQGIALIHPPSKRFLSRPYSLKVLLELFLASRHQPSPPANSTGTSGLPPGAFLSATILDSLLCILVDSSQAIRTFEDVGGVQSVVRLLKRVGTPREVRMKALEFLYFYLMDEGSPDELPLENSMNILPLSTSAARLPSATPEQSPVQLPSGSHPSVMVTSPSTPRLPSCETPSHIPPAPRLNPPSSFTRVASGHLRSRSMQNITPKHRSNSHSSSDSNGSTSLKAVSRMTSSASTDAVQHSGAAKPKNVLLLREGVEYTPISPIRPAHADTGAGKPGVNGASPRLPGLSHSRHRSDASSIPSTPLKSGTRLHTTGSENKTANGSQGAYIRVRSSEEKKAILGDLLGNVDQLVERARKAGIWDAA